MTTIKNATDGVVKREYKDSDYNYNLFAWDQAFSRELWLAVNNIVYNDYDDNNKNKGIKGYIDSTSTVLTTMYFERKYKYNQYNTYTNSVQPEFVNIGLTNPYNYSFKDEFPRKAYYQLNLSDDWFYGKITVSPTGQYVHQTVELKRVGFQVQLDPVMGITDGSVDVTITGSFNLNSYFSGSQTLISGTFTDESTESIGPLYFTYPDADPVWNNADGYEKEVSVSVVWHRGIGVDQQFNTINVGMKRNMLNHIKITVGQDDGNAGMSLVVEPDGGNGEIIEANL